MEEERKNKGKEKKKITIEKCQFYPLKESMDENQRAINRDKRVSPPARKREREGEREKV